MNTLEVARNLVAALEDKKAENIVLIDIHEIANFTDYFIICSGTSDRMLDGLAKAATVRAHELLDIKKDPEGNANSGWLIVDLDDVVIHLFSPDQREYYRLEELWEHGKILLRLQ